MPDAAAASIIVPTYREAANVEPLVERIAAALQHAAIPGEILIIDDDSNDGTEEIVAKLAQRSPVRLIVRRGQRGLSGAVLRGFAEARHDRFVVLDADLQHPPEMIPELLARFDDPAVDFVIGTRYADHGGIETNWPWHRRLISRVATRLARPLAPLSDPMSGFFAIRRQTWEQAAALDAIGYKIALELYVKCGCRRPAEVPIRFAARHAGQSKLSMGVQVKYLRHLAKLYAFQYRARKEADSTIGDAL